MPEKTCRFVTLGCKANQYDTQVVREAFADSGYREAEIGESPDVCVVNTCTVTEHADSDGRYEIRRILRQNPATKVVVMGCYASRSPNELRALPGVALVVEHPSRLGERLREFGVDSLPRGITRFAGHHRAFVKVQDGCMLDCTFCIIPQVRPRLASRSPDEIESEVSRLVAVGYREIVLTGIHLGHYGLEWSRGRRRHDWCRLGNLVRRLASIRGNWRLRLSSIEATEVTDELIDVIAQEPRVCPHLHICLQSGSDRVLKAMRRRYRVAKFLQRIERIRQRLDLPALTTDVIVGFPGETESDFADTMRACQIAEFSKIHIFPYSPRRGTVAAELPDQIGDSTIRERKCQLQALESQLRERYYRLLIGRELQVLVERVSADASLVGRGTACRYMPVELPAQPRDEFQLVDVTVTASTPNHLVGQRVDWLGAGQRQLLWSLPVLEPGRASGNE